MAIVEALSVAQRGQLVNQFRILEKLDPDNATEYQEKAEILANGYTIQYGEVFSEIDEEMDIAECKYVYDVLNLFRVLIQSYEALEDKQGLTLDDVRFKGFDGNNESKRFAFARHLQKQGRWTETLTGGLNSHSISTKSLYPRMLAKYKPIEEELSNRLGDWVLTAAQIQQIIS